MPTGLRGSFLEKTIFIIEASSPNGDGDNGVEWFCISPRRVVSQTVRFLSTKTIKGDFNARRAQ